MLTHTRTACKCRGFRLYANIFTDMKKGAGGEYLRRRHKIIKTVRICYFC